MRWRCCGGEGPAGEETREPLPWIAWGAAVALATIATRNPLYLTLVLLATVIVFLACRSESDRSGMWVLVIRIGLLVAAVSVGFNVLTVHAGDRVLARLPGGLPIIGGAISANALVYGATSALAILSLIVAAATFGSVVDRASMLRAVPRPLSSAGVAAVIGLSFFPQTLISLREVREAQAARGFRIRSVTDVRALVVPVLSLGLEGAFNLAEAMESRAFGGERRVRDRRSWLFPTGLLLMVVSVSLLIGGLVVVAAIGAALSAGIVAFGLVGAPANRTSFQQRRWRISDWLILSTAVASSTIFLTSILFFSSNVVWSPFPTLRAPGFSPWLGTACLLLLTPAPVQGRIE